MDIFSTRPQDSRFIALLLSFVGGAAMFTVIYNLNPLSLPKQGISSSWLAIW